MGLAVQFFGLTWTPFVSFSVSKASYLSSDQGFFSHISWIAPLLHSLYSSPPCIKLDVCYRIHSAFARLFCIFHFLVSSCFLQRYLILDIFFSDGTFICAYLLFNPSTKYSSSMLLFSKCSTWFFFKFYYSFIPCTLKEKSIFYL